jgi:hypothetical protein
VAELVACVSGALVYDVSRLEDPFRSGICSEFIEGVFIVAAPFIPLCGIDGISNGQLKDVAVPVRAPGDEACRAILSSAH